MTEAQHPLARDLDEILEQTRAEWDFLRGKRVFITGGTGFFGKWLLETFAWADRALGTGTEVTVLSRDPEAFLTRFPHLRIPRIRFHRGDIESFEAPEGKFEYAIHAATPASAQLNEGSPLVMFDTILRGTRRTLDFAQAAGVKNLLFTSSGAVYGAQPSAMTHVAEDYAGGPDPLDVRSAYGEAKRAAEFLCATYARKHGFDVKIARCFAFVGPHLPLDVHFAIGNFIRDGLRGQPIRIQGDGTPMRSYLYASELMVWLFKVWFHGQSGRPYNVGSDDDQSIAEIARTVAAEFKPAPVVEIARKPEPGAPIARYVPAIARAKEELKVRRRIELPEAIRRTVQFHQTENSA